MRIGPVEVRTGNGLLRLEASIASGPNGRVCFFEIPEEYSDLVDETKSDVFRLFSVLSHKSEFFLRLN